MQVNLKCKESGSVKSVQLSDLNNPDSSFKFRTIEAVDADNYDESDTTIEVSKNVFENELEVGRIIAPAGLD